MLAPDPSLRPRLLRGTVAVMSLRARLGMQRGHFTVDVDLTVEPGHTLAILGPKWRRQDGRSCTPWPACPP